MAGGSIRIYPSVRNPIYNGELALVQLGKLRGCDVHSSVILSAVDEKVFKRLGVNITCQPQFKG